MASRIDLPQGTLDLLILRSLADEALHGWAISERLQQVSRAVLQVPQGSLYPALHRLERRGWIAAKWGVSARNRKAKFYELTKRGRAELERERQAWKKFSQAVALVLERS
jgi:PadR family transcriptional regulator